MIRYRSTSEFSEVVLSCRVAFSKRSWPYLLATTIPWLVMSGQRHIRRLGARTSWRRHESSYYRFFSAFKFRPEAFFQALLTLIVATFGLPEILIAVDDTLCPKWGRHIFGAGSFFDHVRRPRPGYIWGHNWVVLAVVVRLFGVPVALPFWITLYRTERTCPKEAFRTRLQIVEEVLQTVQKWVSVPIALVADGAYHNKSLLRPLARMGIPLVSRVQSNATLYSATPRKRRGNRGKFPKYGHRLPKLPAMARSGRGWTRIRAHIYGKRVRLKVKSFVAWWPKSGVKIRVVITRDRRGKRKPCFLSSTDLTLTPLEIIERFALRWPIEQLFSDAKLLLGLDSAEVRSEKSVLRHAIFTFAQVTWVRIWARKHLSRSRNRPTSFLGQLERLRGRLLSHTILASIPRRVLSKPISDDLARLAVA
jgi:hypothetical protein